MQGILQRLQESSYTPNEEGIKQIDDDAMNNESHEHSDKDDGCSSPLN